MASHAAKADATSAAANSMCDLSATMKRAGMETTAPVEATTATKAAPPECHRHHQTHRHRILHLRRRAQLPMLWDSAPRL